jgi:hypothetical protein
MSASRILTILGFAGAAAVLAAMAAVPEIAGISTWKIVLGVVGLVLFVMGGRQKPR